MIKISSVTKTFENKKRKTKALNNINITFESKGLCFILGESGAGKTTLLNILSLQDKPTSGTIQIDNVDVSTLNSRSLAKFRSNYFGIVFQELNLIGDFSVYQNIVMGLEIQKKSPQKEEVIEILKNLNLTEDILEEKVFNLSGGQRQRVAIARALIKNLKAIICDEPTGSLDEDNSIEIMDILKKISEERLVIVVSHNAVLARQYGDRIISLENGIIKNDTNPIDSNIEANHEVEINMHTHLPFQFVLKIALSSFKKGLVKFIFTLISFVLTLAVFLVAMSISTFNPESAVEEALKSENISYFDLRKYQNNSNLDYFNELDLKELDEVYKDKYILSHSSPDIYSSSSLNFTYKEDREVENIKNVMYLSSEMLERCNFKIIGSLPKSKEDGFEIALTKYECYNLGWIDLEEMNDETILQEIINSRKYKVKFWQGFDETILVEFDISGIIDTNYLFLDETSAYYDFRNTIQKNNEMHNDVFVSQELFDEIMRITSSEGYTSGKAYHDIYILTEDRAYLESDNVIAKFNERNVIVKRFCKIDYIIQQCNNISNLYGKLSLVASMILLVISLFSFVGFIRFSIEVNKKKMKVLRSLGITMLDSNNMFSLQAFFITLVCLLLAIVPYVITIIQVNAYFKETLNTALSVFNISFIIVLLSFIGLFIISFVITTIINALTFNDEKLKIKEEF